MTDLDQAQARIAELEEALRFYADADNYRYGPSGTYDDRDTMIEMDRGAKARAALTPPGAVWPRVVQENHGPILLAREDGTCRWFSDEVSCEFGLIDVDEHLAAFPADRELHGPEKAAMLAKLGLDENGKAKAKDGE